MVLGTVCLEEAGEVQETTERIGIPIAYTMVKYLMVCLYVTGATIQNA